MFFYTVDALPTGALTVWSQLSLQPLAPGVLTPFSLSVLSEIFGRAWYRYYDQLGFSPRPHAPIVRQYHGRPYLNLSLSAALDADHAGVRPISLRLNQRDVSVAEWEKPGLLTGMRFGRAQRKMADALQRLSAETEQTTSQARSWYLRTLEMKWAQAELLQVMEQIERVSLNGFEAFFVARHHLEWAYNRLLCLTVERAPFPASLALVNNAVRDVDKLVENEMAEAMLAMATLVHDDPDVIAWLKADENGDWATDLPNREVRNGLERFLSTYGHRGADEGEMRRPRWQEDPTPVIKGLLATSKRSAKRSTKMSATQSVETLLAAIDGKEQKEARQALDRIRSALVLQSRSLDAIGYILAGTRQWALAAAAEAMADDRLADADDIFFFELEEIKQMMTGEWNINRVDQIRGTVAERRQSYAGWQAQRVPELLINDQPAEPTIQGLPGAAGHVTAPLRRWDSLQPHICNGTIVGVEQLSSGWAIVLPVAQGIITATGTPMDPISAAARLWHTPIMVGLGSQYDALVEGAQTTVNADDLIVDQ